MGEGIVEKLRSEFELSVEWLGVEIHPDTPPQGRPLAELFRQEDLRAMMQHLRLAGASFGITFIDRPFLSNSHNALLAAEFSREQGRFSPFHASVFSAYFSQGLDIGDLGVLGRLAEASGMDAEDMKQAVRTGRHAARLEQARQEAGLLGLTGVPTFHIGGRQTIVGAQPLDVFRRVLQSA